MRNYILISIYTQKRNAENESRIPYRIVGFAFMGVFLQLAATDLHGGSNGVLATLPDPVGEGEVSRGGFSAEG